MINYSIAEQFNLSLTEIFWETQRQFCVNTRNDLCSRGKYILLKVLPTLMALFWFIVQSVMLGQIMQIDCLAKFTNVQCISQDSNYTVFSECRLYAVKRDVAEMSLRVQIVRFPKYPIAMRIQLLKRASGYKPFLYDIRHSDLCEYLDRRNHPFVNIIFNSFANHTNVNRCPLPSELSVSHFRFPIKSLDKLPLPSGDYAIYSTFSFKEQDKVILQVFFTISEFR